MIRAIRSELIKVRTTSLWWLIGIGVLAFTAIAIAYNMLATHMALHPGTDGPHRPGGVLNAVTGLYTSGQYAGTLLAMVFGILIFTNEFFHQTATATFLATPKRTVVIGAKLLVAIIIGVVIALVTTVLAVSSGAIFLTTEHADLYLGNADVLKSVGLNWLAFAVWAVFGLGIGALLRSQILSVILGLVAMLIGQSVVQVVLALLGQYFHVDWLFKVAYYLPSSASQIMTSPQGANGFEWWAGALVLLAYGAVAAVIGTLITVRRDVS